MSRPLYKIGDAEWRDVLARFQAKTPLRTLAREYKIDRMTLRRRIARAGIRLGEERDNLPRETTGAARLAELRRAESVWSALDIRFDDADVPAERGRLPRIETVVERASSITLCAG